MGFIFAFHKARKYCLKYTWESLYKSIFLKFSLGIIRKLVTLVYLVGAYMILRKSGGGGNPSSSQIIGLGFKVPKDAV